MSFLSRFWCSTQRYKSSPYLPTLILGQLLGLFRTRFNPLWAADGVTALLYSWFVMYEPKCVRETKIATSSNMGTKIEALSPTLIERK